MVGLVHLVSRCGTDECGDGDEGGDPDGDGDGDNGEDADGDTAEKSCCMYSNKILRTSASVA